MSSSAVGVPKRVRGYRSALSLLELDDILILCYQVAINGRIGVPSGSLIISHISCSRYVSRWNIQLVRN